MNILRILERNGRMELSDLASLLLPVSVGNKEKGNPDGEELGEDCETCKKDEDECVICRLRNILNEVD